MNSLCVAFGCQDVCTCHKADLCVRQQARVRLPAKSSSANEIIIMNHHSLSDMTLTVLFR